MRKASTLTAHPRRPTFQPMSDKPVPPQAVPGQARPSYPKQRGLRQAYALRDLSANAALALYPAPTTKVDAATASAIAKLISSWDAARQAIRVYRGLGNPKPVQARNDAARRKRTQTSTPPPPETT